MFNNSAACHPVLGTRWPASGNGLKRADSWQTSRLGDCAVALAGFSHVVVLHGAPRWGLSSNQGRKKGMGCSASLSFGVLLLDLPANELLKSNTIVTLDQKHNQALPTAAAIHTVLHGRARRIRSIR